MMTVQAEAEPKGRGLSRALAAGLAGTATVTLLNEVGRRTLRGAPHAEQLGMRAVRSIARRAGARPGRGQLFAAALAGEVVSNTAYYALAARASRRPLAAGALLGGVAGLGAILLPQRMGLGRWPMRRSRRTARLAFGWYLAGGVAAGWAARAWARRGAVS